MSFPARLAVTALIVLAMLLCAPRAFAKRQVEPSSPALSELSFPQPANWPLILHASKGEETLGPGVRYEHWSLSTASGPLEVSVATLDLRNPYVSLATTSHQGVIQGSDERLSSMADRLHAELGINADYFDISESGAPLNVLLENGRMIHQPDAATAFIALAGNRILMQPMTWHASITTASGATHELSTLNEWSPSSTLALLTPELGKADASGAFEVVLAPLAPPSAAQQPTTYQVRTLGTDMASFYALDANEIAIAARGAQALALAREFAVGDTVEVNMSSDPPWNGIQFAVGGGPVLLNNGVYVSDPAAPAPEETNVRNPVTAAGVSGDGATLLLVVVDGRAPSASIGLTRLMLASLMARLGAVNAMAFDSGGSSEMVVRHLGDSHVSVANAPSDGRERSVADGLFVVNSAPVGAAQQLVLRAGAQNVLVGSHLQLFANAIDANDQPIPVSASDMHYLISPPEVGDIDAAGLLTARRNGNATITAQGLNIAAAVRVQVLAQLHSLKIVGFDRMLAPDARVALSVRAQDASGKPVSVDSTTIQWQAEGNAGVIDSSGVFSAAKQPGVSTITARAGGQATSLMLLVGDHRVQLQDRMPAGPQAKQWHFRAAPSTLNGALDNAPTPGAENALRLRYDFSSSEATRAAYAESNFIMCGQPLAVVIDVFGDANGEWLRGGYRNADGNSESLTLARHVDWRGWKRLRATIPHQAAWPIVWTRFYVVERAKEAREQGAIWLRKFDAVYPGPANLGCQVPS